MPALKKNTEEKMNKESDTKKRSKKTKSVAVASPPEVDAVPAPMPAPVQPDQPDQQLPEKKKASGRKPQSDEPQTTEEEKPSLSDKPAKATKATKAKKDPLEKSERVRVAVTTESITKDLDTCVMNIEDEIVKMKQAKLTGVKFLKCLNKNLKNIKFNFSRLSKKKPKTVRHVNVNAGFSKPVKISEKMSEFLGVDSSELVSRVFVTKFLCQYIKDNDLQNPVDKRQIIADPKLSELLNYTNGKEPEPLTYYRMQTYMRPHFH